MIILGVLLGFLGGYWISENPIIGLLLIVLAFIVGMP